MTDSPLRILLVEDNPGDARLIRELLMDSGIATAAIDVSTTLADATKHLTEQAPDVLLLDLSLPDAHGLETVTEALSVAPSVPIVVLTGLDDERLALQAVQSGAEDYLVKGRVEGRSLGRAIRYAVERKHLAREREQLLELEREARASAEAAVRARDQCSGWSPMISGTIWRRSASTRGCSRESRADRRAEERTSPTRLTGWRAFSSRLRQWSACGRTSSTP